MQTSDNRQTPLNKRVTLQDIADRTGYSVNTISHALRNKSDISQDTAQRIQAIAQEMGYTKNQVASSLRSGRTHVIAVILGGLSNPFYGILADAIQDAAKEKGYTVMIMCSREDPALELHLAEEAIARCADGVLLVPSMDCQPTLERLREAKMPFVLISRIPEAGVADGVILNEAEGAYLATRHLIESGRRKLVYVSGNNILYSTEQRIAGFIKACNEAGIPESDRCSLTASTFNIDTSDHTLWVMAINQRLTELRAQGFNGLFLFCDVEAWHILDILDKSDTLSQDDFGIVSIDNLESALSFPLPLCSVGYSFQAIAENGVRLLRARIHGNTAPIQTVVLPVELICRGSCRRL